MTENVTYGLNERTVVVRPPSTLLIKEIREKRRTSPLLNSVCFLLFDNLLEDRKT